MGESYIDKNHPELTFVAELSAPLHGRRLRDTERSPRDDEADLSGGVRIEADPAVRQQLAKALADFDRFLSVAMEIGPGSYPITLEADGGPEARESYQVETGDGGCRVTAVGVEGLRRALVFLEDEMSLRRGPYLPKGMIARECRVRTRISRSPFAAYRYGTGWELENDEDAYPEEYLNYLAHAGINAVWVAGFFRSLVATKAIPELGPKTTRLDKLRRLIEKAAPYGIKVYFFCMEPRILLDDELFRAYPDIRGAQFPLSCSQGETALCTSTPRVQAYVREAFGELFRAAPGLAGVIDIFAGERATNCWYTEEIVKGCPRCSQRPQWEVLAELLDCINDGIKSIAPKAELLAWDYSSISTETKLKTIERSGKDIVWLGCFEHGGKTELCGKSLTMDEYALSYVGPSEPFRSLAETSRGLGKRLYAKLQLGNTYEQSSLPYVPVPTSVFRKFRAMAELGVDGSMVSWIIGGFPSLMLKAAGEASFSESGRNTLFREESAFLLRLAAIEWGEALAPTVAAAWERFFDAYQLYPAMNEVFYYGPITRCPAYHLQLEKELRIAIPYNWGLTDTREIQPFEDDPARWLGGFTEDELTTSFRRMADIWAEGLSPLAKAAAKSGAGFALRQLGVAKAAWIQFRSCANVIEFYTVRNKWIWKDREKGEADRARMRLLALDEIDLAEQMTELLEDDPTLGFESELRHFSFSQDLLDAKIRHTKKTLMELRSWDIAASPHHHK